MLLGSVQGAVVTVDRRGHVTTANEIALTSLGELSAKITHKINTLIQFIASNISFIQEAFNSILEPVKMYGSLIERLQQSEEFTELLTEIAEQEDKTDIDYFGDEVPKALSQTSDGVERVSQLVGGLKGFAHSTDSTEKASVNINEIINNTLIVCKNAYKYVAEIDLDLGDVPAVPLHHGDMRQVILDLIVNAAQAVEDAKGSNDSLGKISISTRFKDNELVITVSDSGGGIPEDVASRIFDPFFTTKEVGRGSGQGLAITRNIIHDKHGGRLSFQTEVGVGTSFSITIPLS